MAIKNSKTQNPIALISDLIKVARPVHWIKNLSLFAALIFTRTLFVPNYLESVVIAFFSFGLVTSGTYILNDIMDRKADALHPIKKSRPVASGSLPVSIALFEALVLISSSLFLAKSLNHLFFIAVLVYLVLQILYSLFLKHISVIDIIVIASGFVIRVYAGAFVIDAHLSVWFLLCVISTSLFIASGKRRAELNNITKTGTVTRLSLTKYKRELLNSYVTMFGNAAWMSWALFTFFESPQVSTDVWLLLAEISKAITVNKFLMLTIPFVIFSIMRYQGLIFEEKSEAPEKILLKDIPLITSIGIYTMIVVWTLYGTGPWF